MRYTCARKLQGSWNELGVHVPTWINFKNTCEASPNKRNIFHVSFKIYKTLVNAILDAYMLIKVLNMLTGKIHQQQNSGYLRGDKEKGE